MQKDRPKRRWPGFSGAPLLWGQQPHYNLTSRGLCCAIGACSTAGTARQHLTRLLLENRYIGRPIHAAVRRRCPKFFPAARLSVAELEIAEDLVAVDAVSAMLGILDRGIAATSGAFGVGAARRRLLHSNPCLFRLLSPIASLSLVLFCFCFFPRRSWLVGCPFWVGFCVG